jgi:hypothetical protein
MEDNKQGPAEGCMTKTQIQIHKTSNSLRDLLVYKNKKYGDSALHPIKVFSKIDAGNSLCQRADDKISRIQNSEELRKNDVADLIGYMLLICVEKGWDNFDDQKD